MGSLTGFHWLLGKNQIQGDGRDGGYHDGGGTEHGIDPNGEAGALKGMEKPPDVIIRIPVMVMVAKTEMVAPPMTAWGMVVSTAANLGTSPAASSTRAAKANTALLMTRLTVTMPTFWL